MHTHMHTHTCTHAYIVCHLLYSVAGCGEEWRGVNSIYEVSVQELEGMLIGKDALHHYVGGKEDAIRHEYRH